MRVLGFGGEGIFAEFYLLSNLVLENALRFSKDLPLLRKARGVEDR